MSKLFKWNMFVTSFLPLWVSIIIISIWTIFGNVSNTLDSNNTVFVCIFNNITELVMIFVITILVISSMVGINKFIKEHKEAEVAPKGKIMRARKANKLTSEFLLAYILPMIAFDFSDLKFIVLFVIYFFTLAFLCIRNNNVYTNIFLEFRGHKIYDCDIECMITDKPKVYEDCVIISSQDLSSKVGTEIKYWDFEKYIYLDLHKKEKK